MVQLNGVEPSNGWSPHADFYLWPLSVEFGAENDKGENQSTYTLAVGIGNSRKKLKGIDVNGIFLGLWNQLKDVDGMLVGFANQILGEEDKENTVLTAGFVNAGDPLNKKAKIHGVAIGAGNMFEGVFDGVELGLLNIANNLYGTQLGLINIAQHTFPKEVGKEGAQFGLLNFNGRCRLAIATPIYGELCLFGQK